MKLSRTTWIVMVTGIILITAACLGRIQIQQNEQRRQLDNTVILAQARLAKINFDELSSQKDRLTLEIQRYNSDLENVKSKLTFLNDSLGTTDLILDIARMHNVTILELVSPGLGDEELEGTNCGTLVITIKAGGSLSNLVDYIIYLSREFPSGMVKTVEITSDSAGESSATPSPGTIPSPDPNSLLPPDLVAPADEYEATINLTLYNYQGEQDVK